MTKEDRTAIARTGASIEEIGADYVIVRATPQEASLIARLGYQIEMLLGITDFPPADSNYHNYAEMVAEIQQAEADHGAIFDLFPVGTSYQGRTIWAGKISDNVATDEAEAEVLFTHHQHAREHLTVEMALYTLKMLTDEYGVDSQITNLVDNREVWLVFDLNRVLCDTADMHPGRFCQWLLVSIHWIDLTQILYTSNQGSIGGIE